MHLLRPQEKVVHMAVNGQDTEFQMRLGDSGEAFFNSDPAVREGRAAIPGNLDMGIPEEDLASARRAKSAEPVFLKTRTLSAPELPSTDNLPRLTKTLRLTTEQLVDTEPEKQTNSMSLEPLLDLPFLL